MTMQVWPAQTCNITLAVRAIVLQQQSSVLEDLWVLEPDSQVVVSFKKVTYREFLI